MRIPITALITLTAMPVLHARPVACPPPSNLWAMADVVAVIEPIATSDADDKLTSAGPKYGPRDPAHYQAFDTRCRIEVVMKAPPGNAIAGADALTVMHFGQKGGIEANGGLFVYFLLPPTNVVTCIAPEGPSPLQRQPGRILTFVERPRYLAFLSAMPDGRYRATTGDYDAEPSFFFLTAPKCGHMLHAMAEHGHRPKLEGQPAPK